MPSIYVVKGISGSGKSSRVFQIIKYLESIGCEFENFAFTNCEGKQRDIGVLCKDLGILFLGKKYGADKGVERWQGYDAVTGAFVKAKYLSEFLEVNKDKYIFFVEGAGITQTNRLRPKFLSDIGFDNIFVQYYNYENKEDYLNRIIYRSGERPKKDVMWDKNSGFIQDMLWSFEDQENGVKCDVFDDKFDSPIYDLGVKFLVTLGMDDYIDNFVNFVLEFDYINKNKFDNRS